MADRANKSKAKSRVNEAGNYTKLTSQTNF